MIALIFAAPAATAQATPTLSVTPDNIERPLTGEQAATLYFTSTNCEGCWVALDPGWSNPAADQAVKGKAADFGAANYWASDTTIGGKSGKGPVPAALGIKVRAGGERKFIRFTLNDDTGVVAEAKVWLTPRTLTPINPPQDDPGPEPGLGNDPQQPRQHNQPQQRNQVPQVQGQQQEEPRTISCRIGVTHSQPRTEAFFDGDGWWRLRVTSTYSAIPRMNAAEYNRRARAGTLEDLRVHAPDKTSVRAWRPGEEYRLAFQIHMSERMVSNLHFVSYVNARTGAALPNPGFKTATNQIAGRYPAPSVPFTVTYRVESHPPNPGQGALVQNFCSVTIDVK